MASACVTIILATRTAASAAQAASAGPDGRILGYIAGLTATVLVGYAIYLYLKPILDKPDSGLFYALLTLTAIWLVKEMVLPLLPGFGIDVGTYQAWAGRMVEVGPARMYQEGYFLDYPPGYLYALWFVGAIGGLAGVGGEAFRQMTESPALVADFLLALVAFAYVRRSASLTLSFAAMLMVALNPGMLFESVVWGQSDSVSALMMFLCVISVIDGEFELGWALAALGFLVKPQVLLFLPVLGLWTLVKGTFDQWWRGALAFVAAAIITVAPFQLAHSWNWLPSLYVSTTSYYHETSVNAFNLIALVAGLRAPDTTTVLGISCFTLGMTLLAGVYAFIAWILWRKPSVQNFFYCSFLVVFGSFMLAPRMHERYMYPCLVFLIPIALENPMMLGVFAATSVTLLCNLAYVKKVLESPKVFMDARDSFAMVISAINLVALGVAAGYGLRPSIEEEVEETELAAAEEAEAVPQQAAASERAVAGQRTVIGQRAAGGGGAAGGGVAAARAEAGIQTLIARLRLASAAAVESRPAEERRASTPLAWLRADTIALATLVACAAMTRFWRLGRPAEIVFDEVHFVGQARHYLHGEPFLDPHPPLAKLLIALGIWLFGDHPFAWRMSNAMLGTALVGVTYLLGRRMLHSRLAAVLAAAFVLGDGMFLVNSRIAVLDIVYVTFAACSYLMLFRFLETSDPLDRRRTLAWMGLFLGLCLGSKLYVPAITFLLVTGFLIYILWEPATSWHSRRARYGDPQRYPRVGGAILLTGAISAAVYIAIFIPHFLLGWWGGIADLFRYYSDVLGYEASVASATHPYSSPWWSWPLMLRPVAYWQNFPPTGDVMTIWGGGNPALWWGGFTAIAIIAVQAFERRSLWRPFLVIGYLGYLCMWAPIGRTLFLYHYMGSIYLAYLALAAVLAECWNDGGQPWEHLALLLTLAPVFYLGLGDAWGAVGFLAMAAGYVATLLREPRYAGKFTCAAFAAVGLAVFVYYFPVWVGLPIERSGYYARMWLQAGGLRSWI